ncbi:MAG: AAA family ATPase [Deltaproteobacteria bacterium]|nr:AAA family ATPase [Deltaproteobacteria bacterium]MCL5277913.1 AAA family ATPase [Deltaproteobacteria bacterium]
MNYLDFYKLNEEPFSSAPDIKFYYNSAQHSKALVRLMYAVDSMKGLALLIGDIGTGKTTLARRMLDSLPEEEYESALLVIIHSGITADWLLKKIALQLGIAEPSENKIALLSQLYERLSELYEQHKKAVVLIDEAQMLKSKEMMEEFRGLLNLEAPDRKLITFVFFGLPEIEDNLLLDGPLAQRVALKYKLESFNYESSEAYIKHRLGLAGSKDDIFSLEAIEKIHAFSRGIPRMINIISSNALFEGFLVKAKPIEAKTIDDVAADLGIKIQQPGEDEKTEPAPPIEETAETAPREPVHREVPTQKARPAPSPVGPKATKNEAVKQVPRKEETLDEIDSILDKLEKGG